MVMRRKKSSACPSASSKTIEWAKGRGQMFRNLLAVLRSSSWHSQVGPFSEQREQAGDISLPVNSRPPPPRHVETSSSIKALGAGRSGRKGWLRSSDTMTPYPSHFRPVDVQLLQEPLLSSHLILLILLRMRKRLIKTVTDSSEKHTGMSGKRICYTSSLQHASASHLLPSETTAENPGMKRDRYPSTGRNALYLRGHASELLASSKTLPSPHAVERQAARLHLGASNGCGSRRL